MTAKHILNDLLELMDEIRGVVNNKNWVDYSPVRARILITQKMDQLKHTLSKIPPDVLSLFSAEDLTNFFEKILDKITAITSNLDKTDHLMEWYELELFRFNFASMYANMWGKGGSLQVAGTAQALAHTLIGVEILDVDALYIADWNHPEFYKRKKLILNYLTSAYGFFFTLCESLNFVHKHDLINWLEQACRAAELFLKYTDFYWNIPKSIELDKKYQKFEGKPNYSPYYATFSSIDTIIVALIALQRYFFDYSINIPQTGEILNFSNAKTFFETLDRLLEKGEYYVNDFKQHVRNGAFGLNEDPLNNELIKETIHQLGLTKMLVKGNYALYRIIYEDSDSELHLLREIVLPAFFGELERYKPYMASPEFEKSQLADGMNMLLEVILFYAGVYAMKKANFTFIEKVENEYAVFFEEDKLERYPNLNGFYNVLKTTLALKKGDETKLQEYSKNLILLAKYSLYETRNSISFAILGYMLNMLIGQINKVQFLQTTQEKFDEVRLSFPNTLQSEIEIYLAYLDGALSNKSIPVDMTRLAEPKHYDQYSMFIPEISNLAKEKGLPNLAYLPFNLEKDYLIQTHLPEMVSE